MFTPLLSVTLIGLLVAAVLCRRDVRGRVLLLGAIGAWIGFVAGAIAGWVLGIAVDAGLFVSVLGHLAAAGGAYVAVRHADSAALTRR